MVPVGVGVEEMKRTNDFGLVYQKLLELLVLWVLSDQRLSSVHLPSQTIRIPKQKLKNKQTIRMKGEGG